MTTGAAKQAEPNPALPRWAWPVAAAAYLAVACAATWPLITCLGTRLAGAPDTDVFSHVWMHWISREALLESGMLPFRIQTDLLYWPVGGKLHSSDPLGGLVSVPLQALFGVVASYNLLVLAHLTFAATAMFALARRVTGSTPAAFVGGLAFGFSPFLLAEACNGSPELLTAGWLPLLVLALSRVASTRGFAGVLPAAAILCVASLFTWYYGVCACLLLAAHCLFPLQLHGDPPLPLTARLRKHAAVLAVFAVGVAPFLALYLDSLSGSSALVYGGSMHKQHALQLPQLSADIGALLVPAASRTEVLDFHLTSYLGMALVALALVGVLRHREGRRFWLLAGGASLALSLGPVLVFRGQHVTVAGHPLWMPLALLSEIVPPLGNLHFPRRLLVGALTATAALGAIGVATLMRAAPRRWAPVVAGLCAAAVMADHGLTRQAPVPVPTTSAELSPVYETLATGPGEGALLEAPRLTGGNRLSLLFAQTIHHRPIQAGIPLWEGSEASYSAPPLRELQLVRWLADPDLPGETYANATALTDGEAARDIEWLAAMGFSHVLIHTHEYSDQKARDAVALLDLLVGPGDPAAAPYILYTLPGDEGLLGGR